jgi:hypothetical protein
MTHLTRRTSRWQATTLCCLPFITVSWPLHATLTQALQDLQPHTAVRQLYIEQRPSTQCKPIPAAVQSAAHQGHSHASTCPASRRMLRHIQQATKASASRPAVASSNSAPHTNRNSTVQLHTCSCPDRGGISTQSSNTVLQHSSATVCRRQGRHGQRSTHVRPSAQRLASTAGHHRRTSTGHRHAAAQHSLAALMPCSTSHASGANALHSAIQARCSCSNKQHTGTYRSNLCQLALLRLISDASTPLPQPIFQEYLAMAMFGIRCTRSLVQTVCSTCCSQGQTWACGPRQLAHDAPPCLLASVTLHLSDTLHLTPCI